MDVEPSSQPRQALALAFALGAATFSVLPLLAGLLWGVAGQCDEACDAGSTNWRRVAGAWQWNLLPVLGGAVFVAGICLVVFVQRRRAFAAGVSFVAGLAFLWAFAAWFLPGWNDNLDHLGMKRFLLLVCPLCSGALAVFLTEGPERSESHAR